MCVTAQALPRLSSRWEASADGDVCRNTQFGTGKMAPTTKFGRKVSKPKTFVPTNKPTSASGALLIRTTQPLTRIASRSPKKEARSDGQPRRQSHVPSLQPGPLASRESRASALLLHLDRARNSTSLWLDCKQLVICEACNRGWHQLCSVPTIEHSVVDSTLPWFCSSCDAKVSATKTPIDVTVGEGWTNGRGEDKGEGRDAERENEYDEAIKKEWLETMPLHQLVGYVLSVEKSASRVFPSARQECAR